MAVFDAYARYYDALYRDKDYAAEAAFVLSRLNAHGCRPSSLLDLGCGTGRHCLEFAAQMPEVVGIDISARMIDEAQARATGPWPRFSLGDVRSARLGQRFAAVVSLFHVMSYQTADEDLAAAFATAAAHLDPGGLFLFDFWHGAGVLSDPPTRRVRTLRHDGAVIERTAEPATDPLANVVTVRYGVTVRDQDGGRTERFEEVHCMRYLFWAEIRALAEAAGFEPLECRPWMQERELAVGDWFAYALLRRR
jgi:SAM-dependent methyltransferase